MLVIETCALNQNKYPLEYECKICHSDCVLGMWVDLLEGKYTVMYLFLWSDFSASFKNKLIFSPFAVYFSLLVIFFIYACKQIIVKLHLCYSSRIQTLCK